MEALKEGFGDAFVTLPLLIIGFTFFLGMLTSNVGLLYLFLGHLLVVPALSFLGNEPGIPWKDFKSGQTDITKGIKYIVSVIVFFTIHGVSLQTESGSGLSWLIWLAALIPLIGQVSNPEKKISFLDVYNPGWLAFEPLSPSSSANCNMLPHSSSDDIMYNNPSNWVNHISFFFGFIMSNAIAIYNQPTPTAKGSDPSSIAISNDKIAKRVTNRKWIAASVTIISFIIFLILLAFRYNKTECEQRFWIALIPLIIAVLTGSAWFKLVYSKCGVRPADVLGIVQGMIAPELIDNPIVCVGS
jgi:hypothetical protein